LLPRRAVSLAGSVSFERVLEMPTSQQGLFRALGCEPFLLLL
jgi:hypothetical protein